MTRLRLLALALVCLLAGLAVAVPWRVPQIVMRDEIGPQLARIAGLTIEEPGTATFSLAPVPRVEIAGVVLSSGGITLNVPRLRARARLLPLVGGRIEITELVFFGPTLTAPEMAGTGPILSLLDGLFGTGAPGFVHPALERAAVVTGTLRQRDPTGMSAATVTGINILASRASSPSSVDIEAQLVWRGQPLEFDATDFDLAAFLRGPSTRLVAGLRMPLGTIDFDGRIIQGQGWQADGQLKANSPAIDRLAAWAELPLPLPISGTATVSAKTRMTADSLALDGLKVTLPAGTFEGALALKNLEALPSVSGTLAADTVDIERLLAALPDWRSSEGGWTRDIIDPALLPRGDVDLRLSAGRIVAGPVNLGNAAVSVLSRAGRTDIALANAQIFKGDVRGRLSVAPSPRGLDVKLSAAVEKADASGMMQSMGASRRLTGLFSGTAQVESAGDSVHALMRGLEGRATLVLRQGDILGINLPELLRRVEKRPLVTALDLRGGRTPFDYVHVNTRIARGVADLTEAVVQSPATRVTLGGQVGLAERQFAVTGAAQLVEGPEGLALPFEVTGTFEDPQFQPDARSLIRRSGAAAPFFGTVGGGQ